MESPVSLLSETHDAFTSRIFSLCNKGKELASLLYRSWFQKGVVPVDHPAFRHAQPLLHQILQVTDFSLPTFAGEVSDGATRKFLFRTHDGFQVESVYIPMAAGGSLCISSQIGCRQGCLFCETGRRGWRRNLTAQEIVAQVFAVRFVQGLPLRNVVFMGMGEPLDNYDAFRQALAVLGDPKGMAFGRHHLTMSTSGHVDGLWRLIWEPSFNAQLALSLNAVANDLRSQIMPINRRYDLQALYEVMQAYGLQTDRQIFIAYVLLKDVNDSLSHARALADYLRDLPVKINLIPYNASPGSRFQCPDPECIADFKQTLMGQGYPTYLRFSRGTGIGAACGQLSGL